MRVAVYARVSTEDRGQDPENQLAQLRAWCAAAGHEIAAEYIDHASGGKGADRRPRFTAISMMMRTGAGSTWCWCGP